MIMIRSLLCNGLPPGFPFQSNQSCLFGFICIWIRTPVLETENQTFIALDLSSYTKWLLYRLLWAPFMQQLNLYHLRRQSEHRPKDDKFRIIGPSDPRTIAMARICGELFICFIVVGLRSISTAASDIFSLTHTGRLGIFSNYRLLSSLSPHFSKRARNVANYLNTFNQNLVCWNTVQNENRKEQTNDQIHLLSHFSSRQFKQNKQIRIQCNNVLVD